MRTLPLLIVGMLLGAATAAPAAAGEPTLATITVTAKRPHASLAMVDRVPPQAAVEIAAPLPTDMPEMQIDSHLKPIGATPAPAALQVAL